MQAINIPRLLIGIVSLVAGLALTAWGIYTITDELTPDEYGGCPYGWTASEEEEPKCLPPAETDHHHAHEEEAQDESQIELPGITDPVAPTPEPLPAPQYP